MNGHEGPTKYGAGEPVPSDEDGISAAVYRRTAKALLTRGFRRDAYELLQQAVVKHASDPLLLSWYGWLEAALDGKYRSGIEACISAADVMSKRSLHGDDADGTLTALLYLNLGRAYIAADRKKEAIVAFNTGMKYDKGNSELRKEISAMGIRKKIPLPFLTRSNPVNKYLGMLLHRPGNGGAR